MLKLTQEQVKELFDYIPHTGVLKKRTKGTSRKPITSRYVHINIGKKLHNVTTASIIWLYQTGQHHHHVQRKDNNVRRKLNLLPTYDNNKWNNFTVKGSK